MRGVRQQEEVSMIKWAAVARDVVIVFVLTFLVGFVVRLSGASPDFVAIAVSNLFLGVVGFTISGCLARGNRWRHLLLMAIAVWLLSLTNVLLLGSESLVWWIFSVIPISLAASLGGGMSYLFVRSVPDASVAEDRGGASAGSTPVKTE
jgi:hypothetical protein